MLNLTLSWVRSGTQMLSDLGSGHGFADLVFAWIGSILLFKCLLDGGALTWAELNLTHS